MKSIKDTNRLYFASEDGGIYRNGKKLSPINNGKGYFCVVLCVNGKTYRKYIHRLVCETYKENPHNKSEVNHIDGDKSNNSVNNLEWATRSENQNHRYKVLNHKGANYGRKGADMWASKPVLQKSIDGKSLNTFVSVLDAEDKTGINESNIRCCIYGRQKTAGGFKWEYIK